MTLPDGFLSGRTAVVTGAGRGIGQAAAVALAQAGVPHLALLARTSTQLDATAELVAAAGATAHIIAVDLGRVEEIKAVAAAVTDALEKVDVLVNNAGTVAPLGPSDALSAASMLNAFRLNTLAPALLAGELLPAMSKRGWGRIVNVSSGIVAHPQGMVRASTYAATKAALEAQTVSMAAEYADTRVTINIYRPGGVDTAMQGWIREQDANAIGRELHDQFVANHTEGALLSAKTSGQALVDHLGSTATGQIWDVSDSI